MMASGEVTEETCSKSTGHMHRVQIFAFDNLAFVNGHKIVKLDSLLLFFFFFCLNT